MPGDFAIIVFALALWPSEQDIEMYHAAHAVGCSNGRMALMVYISATVLQAKRWPLKWWRNLVCR